VRTIIICGATATGKSDLAVALAAEIGAEIVNADSMQVYQGMDIGTAKLTIEERGGIAHHLLDVLTVREDSTVAWYQEQARATIDEIHSRGRDAIIVGGTGLYIKAIVDDLNFPDTDPVVRSRLELEAIEQGAAALFARLEKLDPAAALAIDRANTRRIVRALEVIEITGKPFTANLPREESSRYPDAFHFGLSQDRESLDIRVSDRVDAMWDAGLVGEVEKLRPSAANVRWSVDIRSGKGRDKARNATIYSSPRYVVFTRWTASLAWTLRESPRKNSGTAKLITL
jgi:tRNA dimethylallyltransferase